MSDTGNSIIMKWLEQAFNRYIALDPEAPQKLAAFSGRVIGINIKGMDKSVYLIPRQETVRLSQNCETEPDAVITGSPLALIRMALAEDSEPLLLSGEIEISGDTRLAQKFRNFLYGMDIDREEIVAGFTGDLVARQLFNTAGKVTGWGRYVGQAVMQDISEYLQEESRDIVSGAELEVFNREVDTLRDDTDRLAARIERLSASIIMKYSG